MATAIKTWQDFQGEIQTRREELANQLPPNVGKERFLAVAVSAVKQNPDLLACTPRSLFSSITKAAQDGLLPDSREGVITPYNEKQRDGKTWLKIAQWNPMAYGLRKKARELDGIIVNCQVIHENDEFDWFEGDDPKLIHKPANLGTDRGNMIGSYAIFRHPDEGILHREVMDEKQIEQVRSQSKNPNGLMWTKFASEGWRKSVLRRGIKSVPCSASLDTIVHRDDEQFEVDMDLDGSAALDLTPSGKARAQVIQGKASEEPAMIEKKKSPQQVGEGADPNKEMETVVSVKLDDVAKEAEEEQAAPKKVETIEVEIVEEKAKKKTATKKKAPTQKSTPKREKLNNSLDYAEGEQNRSPKEIFDEMKNVFSGITDEDEFNQQRDYYLSHPAVEFPADNSKVKEMLARFLEELTT